MTNRVLSYASTMEGGANGHLTKGLKMKANHRLSPTLWITCFMALASANSVLSSDVEAVPAEAVDEIPLVDFLKEGTFHLNMRFRYEHADIDGFRDSNAFTMRTRIGYTTARYEGFQAMIELEDVRSADDDQYNAAGLNGQPGLSVIADPEDTELN